MSTCQLCELHGVYAYRAFPVEHLTRQVHFFDKLSNFHGFQALPTAQTFLARPHVFVSRRLRVHVARPNNGISKVWYDSLIDRQATSSPRRFQTLRWTVRMDYCFI